MEMIPLFMGAAPLFTGAAPLFKGMARIFFPEKIRHGESADSMGKVRLMELKGTAFRGAGGWLFIG
ncbi:MAG: hypothetical protein LBL57_05505 [Tannerella sp.]|jgi:hypothetical protein|nr:hypothetical protein [Tannerella sp.]